MTENTARPDENTHDDAHDAQTHDAQTHNDETPTGSTQAGAESPEEGAAAMSDAEDAVIEPDAD